MLHTQFFFLSRVGYIYNSAAFVARGKPFVVMFVSCCCSTCGLKLSWSVLFCVRVGRSIQKMYVAFFPLMHSSILWNVMELCVLTRDFVVTLFCDVYKLSLLFFFCTWVSKISLCCCQVKYPRTFYWYFELLVNCNHCQEWWMAVILLCSNFLWWNVFMQLVD